jgi:hypothetical protein
MRPNRTGTGDNPLMAEATSPRAWRLTFTQLLAFAAVCVPVLAVLTLPFSAIDVAYLVRAGETMLDTGAILRTETFTFTAAGTEWLNQQWGTELLVGLLFRAGGWPALIGLRAVLVGGIFWLEHASCRAAGASRRAAGWLTLAAFVLSYFALGLRSNLFGLTCFVLTQWILVGRERRPRLLWLVPAIVLVWVNTHGSFPLVFVLLLLAWLDDRRRSAPTARTIVPVALASLAVTFVNPFGAGVWGYVADLATDPRIRETVTEWQPIWRSPTLAVPFLASVAFVVVLVALRRAQLHLPQLLGLAIFGVLGLQGARGVLWWAVAAPVLVAPLLREDRADRDEPALVNTLVASVLVVALMLAPWIAPAGGDRSGTAALGGRLLHAPERFSDAVRSQTPTGARLFVSQIWASWFELELPDRPVFIDARIELFPEGLWREYDAVSEADDGWEATLDRWGVDVLVLSEEQQGALIHEIAGDPAWVPISRSDEGVVLIRATQGPPSG